jgi:hypothetical protein
MDDLDLQGGLGGAMELTFGYARDPLRVAAGANRLAVVSNEAFSDFGAAVTYDRWRFSFNLASPLVIVGQSGVAGDTMFTAPTLSPGSNPDAVSDSRFGVDMRIFGSPGGFFRLGAGAQVLVPFGNRADYDTDGTFRGMLRALAAGDVARFVYASELGVHIRPLDDSATPGAPRGSELLFGAAAGAKVPVGSGGRWAAVVGPEVYGATAFQSLLSSNATALEALLTGRLEGASDDGLNARLKLGVGAGLTERFGTPEWRLVLGLEIFNHSRRSSARAF